MYTPKQNTLTQYRLTLHKHACKRFRGKSQRVSSKYETSEERKPHRHGDTGPERTGPDKAGIWMKQIPRDRIHCYFNVSCAERQTREVPYDRQVLKSTTRVLTLLILHFPLFNNITPSFCITLFPLYT